MIIGEHIKKTFDDYMVFNDLCFTVDDGEYVCFSGASGAGKSTLLNIIGLLEPIDSGRLIINGAEHRNKRELRKFYREEVGFIFQNYALIENKTVRQNIQLVKRDAQSRVTIEDALSWVGLAEKIDQKVFTLSGGEQQRVALARLMVKKCDLVLADEPTGSLDSKNADIVMHLISELNNYGKTVVLVTHDEDARKRADRVIQL